MLGICRGAGFPPRRLASGQCAPMTSRWWWRAALGVAGLTMCSIAAAIEWQPCRLKSVTHEAQCGVVRRPLDPARPDGTAIDIHVALVPALARHKLPDPVFFIA